MEGKQKLLEKFKIRIPKDNRVNTVKTLVYN